MVRTTLADSAQKALANTKGQAHNLLPYLVSMLCRMYKQTSSDFEEDTWKVMDFQARLHLLLHCHQILQQCSSVLLLYYRDQAYRCHGTRSDMAGTAIVGRDCPHYYTLLSVAVVTKLHDRAFLFLWELMMASPSGWTVAHYSLYKERNLRSLATRC